MRLSNRFISVVLSTALVIGLVPTRPTYVLAEPDDPSAVEAVEQSVSSDESEVDTETPENPEGSDTEESVTTEEAPAYDEALPPVDQKPDEQVSTDEEVPQDEPTVEETEASIDDDAPVYDPSMTGEDAPRLKPKKVLRSVPAGVPETRTKQEIIDYINAHPFDLDSADTYDVEPDVSSFVAGDLTAASRQNALNALNTFRYIAGIGSDVTLDDTYNYKAQVASLVNAANGKIDHHPNQPEGMESSLYNVGYSASSRSNLAMGQNNAADAIYAYFGDDGDNNHNVVGHRQWVLSSQLGTVGIGQIGKFNATYISDGGSSGVETKDVAWPARLMPTTFFGVSYQWSFSTQLSELGASESIVVHVMRQRDGMTWDLTSGDNMAVNEDRYGYDNNRCIIWDMPGVGSYEDGDIFDVTIRGDAGEKTYQVEFFDLYKPDKLTIMNGSGTTYENGDSIAVGSTLETMNLFFLPCYKEETLAGLTEAQQSLAWAAADEIVISYSSSNEDVATTSIQSPHTNSIYSSLLGRWYPGDRRCTLNIVGTGTTEITAAFSNGTTVSVTLVVGGKSVNDASVYKYKDVPTYDGTPKEYVSRILYDGATLTKDVDYTLEYQNNVNAGTNTAVVIIRGAGEFVGTRRITFTINPASITSAAMASIPTQDHTGSPIEPPLTLTYKGMTLEAGTDYEVSYENNVNAGTAFATVAGKGNYTGTTTASFAIVKTLSDQDIQPIEDVLWDGTSSVTVTPVVTDGEKTLVSGTDYVLQGTNSFNALGAASITVEGMGSYTGTVTASFTIYGDISKASVATIPAQTYSGAQLTPQPTVTFAGTTLTKGVDYEVSYESNVNAGTATTTITGIGNYQGTASKTFNIIRASISSATISSIAAQTYTGEGLTPTPTVKLGSTTLALNTDYTLSYENNVNAGTATVTVTGTGNFDGTKSTTFTIRPKTLTAQNVEAVPDVLWDGSSIVEVTPVVKDGSKTLVSGTDYAIKSYLNNNCVGSASVTLEGKGNYAGTVTASFTIYGDISKASVAAVPVQTYSGSQLTPHPKVTFAGETLSEGVDYEVAYANNVNAGTANVTITGIGNYQGTKDATFTINRAGISGATVSTIAAQTYTGSAIKPKPTVKMGSTTLKLNTDYTLSYQNNVNAGTATVKVTGKGNYTGTTSKTFTINPKAINDQSVEAIGDVLWDGSSLVEVSPVVKDGTKSLVSGTDYAIKSYLYNDRVGVASVTVEGKGNYTGTATASFTIYGDFSHAVIADVPSQVYAGSELEPQLTVTFAGVALTAGTDYETSYSDNVEVGEASVALSGLGYYRGEKSTSFTINPKAITDQCIETIEGVLWDGSSPVEVSPVVKDGTKTLVSGIDYAVKGYLNNDSVGVALVTVEGEGNYTGMATAPFAINGDFSKASVAAISAQIYSGSQLKPQPVVTFAGETLTEGVDYETTYSDDVDAGIATVTMTGIGNYVGAMMATFVIDPADLSSATISSIAAQIYTGKALTPKPTVKVGNATLIEGTDYTLSYKGNVNVGTATVTITGKGNYAGTKTATFKVSAAPISKATASAIADQPYTGKALTPKPTVKYGTTTLKLGTDYTLSYKNNTKAGTATVTITGKGNYSGTRSVTFKIVAPSVSYRTHVQNVGWQAYVKDGAMSGTSGRSLRLEGINIKLSSKPVSGGITYRTHVQNIGWQGWRSDGAMSGTSGRALRLEAIQIKLTGEMARRYDVYYRVHCQNIGWMGWAKNGQQSGSAGFGYRLEGIQVVLVPKGAKAPASTYKGIKANTTQAFRQR